MKATKVIGLGPKAANAVPLMYAGITTCSFSIPLKTLYFPSGADLVIATSQGHLIEFKQKQFLRSVDIGYTSVCQGIVFGTRLKTFYYILRDPSGFCCALDVETLSTVKKWEKVKRLETEDFQQTGSPLLKLSFDEEDPIFTDVISDVRGCSGGKSSVPLVKDCVIKALENNRNESRAFLVRITDQHRKIAKLIDKTRRNLSGCSNEQRLLATVLGKPKIKNASYEEVSDVKANFEHKVYVLEDQICIVYSITNNSGKDMTEISIYPTFIPSREYSFRTVLLHDSISNKNTSRIVLQTGQTVNIVVICSSGFILNESSGEIGVNALFEVRFERGTRMKCCRAQTVHLRLESFESWPRLTNFEGLTDEETLQRVRIVKRIKEEFPAQVYSVFPARDFQRSLTGSLCETLGFVYVKAANVFCHTNVHSILHGMILDLEPVDAGVVNIRVFGILRQAQYLVHRLLRCCHIVGVRNLEEGEEDLTNLTSVLKREVLLLSTHIPRLKGIGHLKPKVCSGTGRQDFEEKQKDFQDFRGEKKEIGSFSDCKSAIESAEMSTDKCFLTFFNTL